jgi:magnesium transporter
MLTLFYSDPKGEVKEYTDAAMLPELLKKPGTVWVDFFCTTDAENKLLETVFHLHPIAVEDVVEEFNYPQIHDFNDYLVVIVHGLRGEADIGKLKTAELDMVIGKRWIITHRTDSFRSIDETMHLTRKVEGFLARGPHRIAQAIVDSQATRFVERVDKIDEVLSNLEEQLFVKPSRALLQQIFRIKRDLSQLKRIIVPQREVFNRLARAEFAVIPQADTILFRDVYDHVYRVAETVDALRDLATGALESYMSMVSQRTNEIVRVLTIISTVILPLTLITGYYGMNFKHMPELDWPFGQYIVLGLMVALTGALLLLFRRRKWI